MCSTVQSAVWLLTVAIHNLLHPSDRGRQRITPSRPSRPPKPPPLPPPLPPPIPTLPLPPPRLIGRTTTTTIATIEAAATKVGATGKTEVTTTAIAR